MDDDPAPKRVSTLELFFDLVFVFTITQLTQVLAHDLTWLSLWHVAVLLAVIFWMYDGYAWLTNNVEPDSVRVRVLLLGGMVGYLVIALAIPSAFSTSGLAFGLAYLVVVLVHTFLFTRSSSRLSANAIRGVAPYNLLGALLLVIGGAVGGTTQEILWPGFVVLVWGVAHVSVPVEGFRLGAAHFIERHGLLVIVAIGESVVAIGIGAAGEAIDAALVVTAALALAVTAALWWVYFGRGDDVEAEESFAALRPERRPRVALWAFGYAHAVILFGIVLVAVGIKAAVADPGGELEAARAFALAGGVTLFLAGDAMFRAFLGLGHSWWRLLAGIVVLVAVPAGTWIDGAAALAVCAVVPALALAAEGRFDR